MDELSIKFAKIVELEKTKNKVRWLAIGAILSLAVTMGAGAKTIYDYQHLEPEDLDDALLALKCSEYGEYVNYMQDKYCEDLTNGKIDVVEYSHLCEHLNSEEGIVEWAKTLNDEKVDEAIEIYNIAKRKRLQTTIANVGITSLGGIALGASGVGFLNNVSKYSDGKKAFDKEYKDGGYIPR